MLGVCPRENTPGCPYMERGGCASNEHHRLWPRRRYKSQLEKQFRDLPENKEQLCRWEHDLLHEFELPPEKPSLETMLVALSQLAIQEADHA
jgi:hypothetical protein